MSRLYTLATDNMADLAEIVPLAVHTTYSFVFHPCELVPGFPVSRFLLFHFFQKQKQVFSY